MTNKEAISWLVGLIEHCGEDVPIYDEDVEALGMAIESLEEKRTAKWEYVQYGSPKISNFHCSNCRRIAINHELSEYCPRCGARMEVEENANSD